MNENQELVRELNDGERALVESGSDLVFVGITVKLPDESETSDVAQALFILSELVEDMRLSILSRLRIAPQQVTEGGKEEVDVGQLFSAFTTFHLRSVAYGTPLTTIFVCVTAFAIEEMASGFFQELGKRLASPDDRERGHPEHREPSRLGRYERSLRILGVEVFRYQIERRAGKRQG
jgi:hypothetical protein